MPIGSPLLPKPHGIVSEGTPAIVNGELNFGSPVPSWLIGAVFGAEGTMNTVTFSSKLFSA
jgi:hypothetical protein